MITTLRGARAQSFTSIELPHAGEDVRRWTLDIGDWTSVPMKVPPDNTHGYVPLNDSTGFLRNDGRLDDNTASSACTSKALGHWTLWLQIRYETDGVTPSILRFRVPQERRQLLGPIRCASSYTRYPAPDPALLLTLYHSTRYGVRSVRGAALSYWVRAGNPKCWIARSRFARSQA